VAQPTVSKHLSILEEAGWLDKQRQGTFINYELISGLDPEDHRAILLAHLSLWLKEDPELTALCRLVKNLHRHDLLKKAEKATPGVCRTCGGEITQSER
jgi:ArsR family transcriptional regulator